MLLVLLVAVLSVKACLAAVEVGKPFSYVQGNVSSSIPPLKGALAILLDIFE